MAVIIENMEMPSSCEDCPFSSCKGRLNDFYCDITTFDVDMESKERDADCPLKEIAQEPQTFKWCDTCKEYDQEKHCCHRWSKVIRDTVEEMKQEYIEREVLDKIRAEIDNALSDGMIHKKTVLGIIDKYKAKFEPQKSEDKEPAHEENN